MSSRGDEERRSPGRGGGESFPDRRQRGSIGSEKFSPPPVDFEWDNLSEQEQEEVIEILVQRLVDTAPIEEVLQNERVIERIATEVEQGSQLRDFDWGNLSKQDQDKVIETTAQKLMDSTVLEDVLNEDRIVEQISKNIDVGGELTRVVNNRVVAPLLLATATFGMFAAFGAFLNGAILIGLVILPMPVVNGWILWRGRNL